MHLANTSIIPFALRWLTPSHPTHHSALAAADDFFLLTRPFYQNLPLEPLLIYLPILAHLGSGVALRLLRRQQNLRRYGAASLSPAERMKRGIKVWPALSWNSISGYALLFFAAGHIALNRLLPWYYMGDNSAIGLQYAAHGWSAHPVQSWGLNPVLIWLFTAHSVWGWARWLGASAGALAPWKTKGLDKVRERKQKRRWWQIYGVASGLAVVWMAGLTVIGFAGPTAGWAGRQFDELYGRVGL
jgi:hypothetical protein